MYGDKFYMKAARSKMVAHSGRFFYQTPLDMNLYANSYRKFFNQSYWSPASHLRHNANNTIDYIGNFEKAITHLARESVSNLKYHHLSYFNTNTNIMPSP